MFFFRPLIGCLQKLEIDNKPLSKEQADHAIGVFVGTCHQERVSYPKKTSNRLSDPNFFSVVCLIA